MHQGNIMSNKSIYAGTLKLAAGALGSRILGFARVFLSAKLVGGGHEMDIFTAAFRIPNLLRGILGEKASESAFLPVYKTLHSQGKKEEAAVVTADTFKILLLLLVAFTSILLLMTPFIVSFMSKGFHGIIIEDGKDKFQEAVRMTRLLSPLIIMIGFFSFLGARMLAQKKFGAYAFAPLIANIVTIAVIVLSYPKLGWYCLAWGVLAGALSSCLFFWILTKDRSSIFGKQIFSVNLKNPDLKKAGKLWAPITFGSGLEKIGTIIETQMASFLGKGAISALNYANLINLLPFSVLGLSFNRSVIPYLTEQNAKANHHEFRRAILMGIRMNLLLLLPATCFMIFLCKPIVELLLQYGKFDIQAASRTAVALRYYAIGLVAMGWMGLFSRAFYALLNTKTPLKVSAFTLCLNIALNFALWKTPLRHAGLALSASIAFWVNAITMFVLLNKKLRSLNAGILWKEIFDILWRSTIPAAAVVFVILQVWPLLIEYIIGQGVIVRFLRMSIISFLAIISFGITGWLSGMEELRKLNFRSLKSKPNNF